MLNKYLGNTSYKASYRLIDMLKRSCAKRLDNCVPAKSITSIYFFSRHGIKNLKILCDFFVLKSRLACSLHKPPVLVSFAEVTNICTVKPLSHCARIDPARAPTLALLRQVRLPSFYPSYLSTSAPGTAISLFLDSSYIPSTLVAFLPSLHSSDHRCVLSYC